MNTNHLTPAAPTLDTQGRKLAGYLTDASPALAHDISERLRVARLQAMSRYKAKALTSATEVASVGGAAASLRLGGGSGPWWARVATLAPLLLLLTGLFLIDAMDLDNRAKELAEIDTELLADDLPPAAYTDPGFLQFLKSRPLAPIAPPAEIEAATDALAQEE